MPHNFQIDRSKSLFLRSPRTPKEERRLKQWTDRLAVAHCFLKPDALANEPELIASKWPAYCELDPMAANIKFATAYHTAFQAQFRIDVDKNDAEEVQGLNIAHITHPSDRKGHRSELTAVNSARQCADALGMPYKPFIKFCMQFASDRGVKHIARPNQLVPTTVSKFRAAWDRELKDYLSTYKVGLPSGYQDERRYESSSEPGCFGVPGAVDPNSVVCATCPVAEKCAKLARAVVTKVEREAMKANAVLAYEDKHALVLLKRKTRKTDQQRSRRATRRMPSSRAAFIARIQAACMRSSVMSPSKPRASLAVSMSTRSPQFALITRRYRKQRTG